MTGLSTGEDESKKGQGQIQKIQNGLAWAFATYIDTIYFTENSLKIIQNFTISQRKGWLQSTRSTSKSAHEG